MIKNKIEVKKSLILKVVVTTIVMTATLFLSGCKGCTYFFLKIENLDSQNNTNSTDPNSTNNNNDNGNNSNAPQNQFTLSVLEIGSKYIKLNWNKDEQYSPSPTYKIIYGFQTGSYIYQIDSLTNTTSLPYSISGLSHSTNYFFKVIATYSNGTTLESNEVQATTIFNCSEFSNELSLNLKGTGVKNDPYIICNENQFEQLSKVSNSSYYNKSFKLENNIDVSLIPNFVPIGDSTNPFSGVFDGNNKIISNWSWSHAGLNNVGIFGYVHGGQILNLQLNNFTISNGTGDNTGSLIGKIEYDNTSPTLPIVKNITVTNSNINSARNNVGGVVGYCECGLDTIIIDATNTITSLTSNSVGGVAGYIHTNFNINYFYPYVLNSQSGVDIDANLYVGGIVGQSNDNNHFDFDNGVIYNSSYSGTINGNSTLGGIIGLNKNLSIYFSKFLTTGTINGNTFLGGITGSDMAGGPTKRLINNASEGAVLGTGDHIGGIAGFTLSAIGSNYSSGIIQGKTYVGGIAGELTNNMVASCYSSSTIVGAGTASSKIGGIVGYLQNWIVGSYFRGSFSNIPGGVAGGLVGDGSNATGNVYSSVWDQTQSGLTVMCGVSKTFCNDSFKRTTTQIQTQYSLTSVNSFSWSFYNNADSNYDIWYQESPNSYPELLWKAYEDQNLNFFSGGSGSVADPYIITTADQLNFVSLKPFLLNKHYKLGNNIDFATMSTPFDIWRNFSGSLDGNNFSFLNLNLSHSSDFTSFVSPFFDDGSGIESLYFHPILINSDWSKKIFSFEIKNLNIVQPTVLGGADAATLFTGGDNYFFIQKRLYPQFSNINITQASIGTTAPFGPFASGIATDCGSLSNVNFNGTVTSSSSSGGAFGLCYYGRNFDSVNVNANLSANYVGGFFGMMDSGLGVGFTANSITTPLISQGGVFSGTITSNYKAAGIAVEALNSKILNTSSTITITAGTSQSESSGFIGKLENSIIEMSSSSGLITNGTIVGGLVSITSGSLNSIVLNSYSNVNINAGKYVGGLIGQLDSLVEITNNYYSGTINTTNVLLPGGLIGNPIQTPISNSKSNFWNISLNPSLSDTSVGSLNNSSMVQGKTSTELKNQTTYTSPQVGWDFSTVWQISPIQNSGYPTLRQN